MRGTKKTENGPAKSEPTTQTQSAAQQILGQVQSANIDSQTTAQFTGLNLISQARTNLLQRQAATLTAQFGASDSRVAALQNSIQSEQSLASKLGAVRDQAATPAPAVPANGWVLQGRVRDQNGKPVAQLTVLLVDNKKMWLRTYGYAFTDKTGYFILSYSPETCDKNEERTTPGLYLEVLDQEQQPLYIDTSPFQIAVGSMLYRDITLPSQTPLGTPPKGAESIPSADC